jgi:hypothetical protein
VLEETNASADRMSIFPVMLTFPALEMCSTRGVIRSSSGRHHRLLARRSSWKAVQQLCVGANDIQTFTTTNLVVCIRLFPVSFWERARLEHGLQHDMQQTWVCPS